ncbi:Cell wall proline rich protein [Geosmithia morbida]|uniref:Cell wall proline rich protein n=1 Tax=Geosmithia morbida TaxID=1094350 RepID=A0A9P5D4I2_9HYPO|nr:Cell wall proline rich protein [Geosmithia morbida]KAF4123571.1 Cell wall proline rich protein [Geosmithia morbida]
MATAFSPELVPAATLLHTMDPDSFGTPGGQHLAQEPRTAPPPTPSFSFPARSDSGDELKSKPEPYRPAKRRPVSAIEGNFQSYKLAAERAETRAALPQFSFNPGATLPSEPQDDCLSPPRASHFVTSSVSTPRPTGHGHRRGGSEFVGGRIREGNSIAVISGSPTRLEADGDLVNVPNNTPQQPRRRGHRRGVSSAALSISDLNLPLPNPSFSFGGSAPTSPTNFDRATDTQLLEVPKTPVFECGAETEPEPQQPANEPSEPAITSTSRARVGFSDTLEYIPRPLSLVSTDTSSTVTVRPGHSVSGSVSSFVTAPTGRDSPGPPPSHTTSSGSSYRATSRPSTAGAILERTPTAQAEEPDLYPRRRNSIPALVVLGGSADVSSPEPSPTKSKRWTFFGLDHFSNHHVTHSRSRPSSSGSVDSATRFPTGSSSEHSESQDESKPSRSKKNKRRKMVKGWAGSILPRIPKRSKYSVRPPTPPASGIPPDEDEDEQVPDAETLSSPPPHPQPVTPTVTITESPDLPPRKWTVDDLSSPMIDLDAALGPFNTPLPRNAEWDAAQHAAGTAGRRRLHSAQGMRGFTGPGMHYHRRAESAPNLPPFDMSRAAISRYGSSSTMADVFEEEEEEEDHGRRGSGSQAMWETDSDGDATPPAVTPLELPPMMHRRKSSGVSDRDPLTLQSIRAQRSGGSLQESVIAEEPGATTGLAPASSDVSVSPRQSPRSMSKREPPPPSMELGLPHQVSLGPSGSTPISPYSMSFASSPRSPMSADTQRLSTAPSSVNEDNSFQSLLMGEPGPEVRLSVDYDIPSLTSSTSATTRDSSFTPQARMSLPRPHEPRPLSVSSAAFGRRRSSLASISRMISSSHGERSKLSMEVPMETEGGATDGKKHRRKGNRLGRFVQFWKTKGTNASS